jgi:hypothetical protein
MGSEIAVRALLPSHTKSRNSAIWAGLGLAASLSEIVPTACTS